jgi:hypothetical protein
MGKLAKDLLETTIQLTTGEEDSLDALEAIQELLPVVGAAQDSATEQVSDDLTDIFQETPGLDVASTVLEKLEPIGSAVVQEDDGVFDFLNIGQTASTAFSDLQEFGTEAFLEADITDFSDFITDVGDVSQDISGINLGDDLDLTIDPLGFLEGSSEVFDVLSEKATEIDPTNLLETVITGSEQIGNIPSTGGVSGIEGLQGTLSGATDLLFGGETSESLTEDFQGLEAFVSTLSPGGEGEDIIPAVSGAGTALLAGDDAIIDTLIEEGFENLLEAVPFINEQTTDDDLADIASRFGFDIERLKQLRARMQGLLSRQAGLLFEEGETSTGRSLLG